MTSRKLADDINVLDESFSEIGAVKRQRISTRSSQAVLLPSGFFDGTAAHKNNVESTKFDSNNEASKKELEDNFESELAQLEREIQHHPVPYERISIPQSETVVSTSTKFSDFSQNQSQDDIPLEKADTGYQETNKQDEENTDFQDALLDQIAEQNQLYKRVDQLKRLRQAKFASSEENNQSKTGTIAEKALNSIKNMSENTSTNQNEKPNSGSDADSDSDSDTEDLWRNRGI